MKVHRALKIAAIVGLMVPYICAPNRGGGCSTYGSEVETRQISEERIVNVDNTINKSEANKLEIKAESK